MYPKLHPMVDLPDKFKHRWDNDLKEHNVLKHLSDMRAKIHERTHKKAAVDEQYVLSLNQGAHLHEIASGMHWTSQIYGTYITRTADLNWSIQAVKPYLTSQNTGDSPGLSKKYSG